MILRWLLRKTGTCDPRLYSSKENVVNQIPRKGLRLNRATQFSFMEIKFATPHNNNQCLCYGNSDFEPADNNFSRLFCFRRMRRDENYSDFNCDRRWDELCSKRHRRAAKSMLRGRALINLAQKELKSFNLMFLFFSFLSLYPAKVRQLKRFALLPSSSVRSRKGEIKLQLNATYLFTLLTPLKITNLILFIVPDAAKWNARLISGLLFMSFPLSRRRRFLMNYSRQKLTWKDKWKKETISITLRLHTQFTRRKLSSLWTCH